MKLQEIKEIANDTGVHAERGYHLKNFANQIVELDRQQRTWVGLTKDEVEILAYKAEGNTWKAVELTETKLKEKNNG